jgi:hypothetical protein
MGNLHAFTLSCIFANLSSKISKSCGIPLAARASKEPAPLTINSKAFAKVLEETDAEVNSPFPDFA